MRFELKEVSICAEKEFELIRITDPVREFVAQTGVKNGVVYVITEHTTTGIMVNESLPCVEKDIMETLDRHHRRQCTRPSQEPAYGEPLRFSDRRGQDQAGQRSGYLFLRVRWHQKPQIYDLRHGRVRGLRNEKSNRNGRQLH